MDEKALLSRNQLITRNQLIEVYGTVDSLPLTYSQSGKTISSESSFSLPRCFHRFTDCIEKYFKLDERNPSGSWKTELKAAFADYVTMAYILAVNASMLTQTGGTCPTSPPTTSSPSSSDFCSISVILDPCLHDLRLSLITATAASTCISTFIMGIVANQPFALAPGMGMNAYFVYTVVGTYSDPKKLKYEAALLATLLEGCIFLLASIFGITSYISKLIPLHLKLAITAGIGLFLARIGFEKDQGIGLIDGDEMTFGYDAILGICGVLLMMILSIRRVQGSMIWSMLIISFISYGYCGSLGQWKEFKPIWRVPQKVRYIPRQIFNISSLTRDGSAGYFEFVEAGITFLVVDILDTTGALYGLADYAKILDKDKNDFEGSKAAFCADAAGTIIGSVFGTSPVTTFIESSSGIHEGGRTGITAIFLSIFFCISLFFSPIFASIPRYATGACLIIFGVMNIRYYIGNIKWSSPRIAIPAGLTMIVMPFSKSIPFGIVAGCLTDLFIKCMDKLIGCCIWRFGPCSCCKPPTKKIRSSFSLSDIQIISLFKRRILGMQPNDVLDIGLLKEIVANPSVQQQPRLDYQHQYEHNDMD